MTARMTCTAVTAESAMLSAQNILAVTVVKKMVLNSLFIAQSAVVAEAFHGWKLQLTSCHLTIIIQQAIWHISCCRYNL